MINRKNDHESENIKEYKSALKSVETGLPIAEKLHQSVQVNRHNYFNAQPQLRVLGDSMLLDLLVLLYADKDLTADELKQAEIVMPHIQQLKGRYEQVFGIIPARVFEAIEKLSLPHP